MCACEVRRILTEMDLEHHACTCKDVVLTYGLIDSSRKPDWTCLESNSTAFILAYQDPGMVWETMTTHVLIMKNIRNLRTAMDIDTFPSELMTLFIFIH